MRNVSADHTSLPVARFQPKLLASPQRLLAPRALEGDQLQHALFSGERRLRPAALWERAVLAHPFESRGRERNSATFALQLTGVHTIPTMACG
jgi:hypothetical protein